MMAWTDERMDDLAAQMRHGFAVVNKDIRDLRAEIKGTRSKLEGDIAGLRTELKGDIAGLKAELEGDIADLRTELKADNANLKAELKGDNANLKAEIAALRTTMNRWAVVIVLAMLGGIGTNVAPGVGG